MVIGEPKSRIGGKTPDHPLWAIQCCLDNFGTFEKGLLTCHEHDRAECQRKHCAHEVKISSIGFPRRKSPTVLRPGLKLPLSCRCRGRSCRGSLACRRASGRVACGGGQFIFSSAVVAPRAKQHQRANDYYRRNNSTSSPSPHSGPAVIKASPVIRCSITKSGPVFASRLVIRITHFNSPKVEREKPFNSRIVSTRTPRPVGDHPGTRRCADVPHAVRARPFARDVAYWPLAAEIPVCRYVGAVRADLFAQPKCFAF